MTWEYIAGFIDGEGSIIKRSRGYNVIISQTNFKVLDEIRKFIGNGYVYKLKKRQSHWKDAWVYSAGGNKEAYYIILHIADKLIVKKDLAYRVRNLLEKRFIEIQHIKQIRKMRLKQGEKLRRQGLTYREIGKKLNADFGYMRRLLRGEI